MEETYRASAIILSSQPFREYDGRKIIYSLEKGRLSLVARGVKRMKSKLAAHLEPLSLSEIMVIRGRQFDYIGAAISRNCYLSIKNNLSAIKTAGRAIMIFNKLVSQEEGDKRVFSLLKIFLDFLNKEAKNSQDDSLEIWADFFILKLLAVLGYEPEMNNCLKCHKKISPSDNNFDLNQGGLICKSCSNQNKNILPISDNCIKVLRECLKNDFNDLKKLKIEKELEGEIGNIISSFCQHRF
ncbi:MAG: DNA repair protein RecO [Patescibacteria group bacterium]